MSTSRVGIAAILFIILVFKGTIISFLVPVAGAPLEVYHYRIADSYRIADQIPGGSAGIIRKELSQIIRYTDRNGDRIERRSHPENRRLSTHLKESESQLLVTTTPYMPPIKEFPGYYSVMGVLVNSMNGLEIRWRWYILRMMHLLSMALACIFIMYAAVSMTTTGWITAVWSGYVFITGPGFGLDGSLIGPHAVLTCLWSFYIWRATAFLRSQTIPDAAIMAVTAFAMSSIHIHGFIAFLVTIVLYGVVIVRLKGWNRAAMLIPAVCTVSGVFVWVLRGIARQDFIGEEYLKANTLIMQIFSRATWSTAPADGVPYVWGAIVLVGIIGLYVFYRTDQIPRFPAIFPLFILFMSVILSFLYPDIFMAWGALSPALAVLLGIGLSVLNVRFRALSAILILMVVIDLYDLLHHVVRMFS